MVTIIKNTTEQYYLWNQHPKIIKKEVLDFIQQI